MKKIIRYISIILFCSLFMFLVVDTKAEANYESSKNTVNVKVTKEEVTITVRYQRGMDKEYSTYRWCQRGNQNSTECTDIGTKVNYISIGGDASSNYIAQGEPKYVDNNITTVTFVVPKEKDKFLGDNQYEVNKYYSIVVEHYFCAVRTDGYNGCQYYDSSNTKTVLDVTGNDLINGKPSGGTGASSDDVEDDGLRELMEQIYDIVHNTVMPIIWGVLGLFLVVKGALLGVQIVKSADEPQVRQEKIGSLKWLVIGVAIAYASSFVVDIVIGFFSDAFSK